MRLTWNELTVSADTYTQADLLSEWRWLLGTSYQIILVSSLGDIFQGGLRLARGQCFSYRLPPMLGGVWEPANFEPTDLSVHFSILGQVCRQVRALPEGTPVSSIKFVSPAT